ncbi:MAG: Hsp70 family protein [Cetobacterium sp.]
MKEIYLGIDFGNTNIKVSVWNKSKKEPKAFSLGKAHTAGDKVLKNFIYYENKNHILLGEGALLENKPRSSVKNIKQKLEKKEWKKNIENLKQEKKIEDVISDILSYVKKEIEEKHGNDKITNTVLTVPVHFSEIQKKIIKKVCEKIKLPIESIVTEPVAAAIGINILDEIEDGDKLLIFDFGGGTLDLAICEFSGDEEELKINILNSYGIKFGGRDIDDFMYKNFLENKINISNLAEEDREKIESMLVNKMEKTKENIFTDDEDNFELILTEGDLQYKHPAVIVNVSKIEIEKYFQNIKIKERIINVIENMLEESDLEIEDIKRVRMVGGSSRIKYFQEILSEYFNDDDILDVDDIDEDEIYYAVSHGACKYLNALMDEDYNLEIENSIPYEILIGNKKRKAVDKNSKYEYYSPTRPISEEEKKGIEIYQSFPDFENIDGKNENIYVGTITYNESQYLGVPYYRIGTNKKGEITCRFYDSNNFLKIVEEFKI